MSNPFLGMDPKQFDGMELRPGVYILGEIGWSDELQRWTALANVEGCLATIELRLTTQLTGNGDLER